MMGCYDSCSPFHAQARLRNPAHGTCIWHLISFVPFKNEDGDLIHWTGFFVDINAQKMIEATLQNNAELKDTQQKLVEYQARLESKITELNISNHELEQFAYIASHDLKEPLRKIVTFSDLIKTNLQGFDSNSLAYFEKIIESARQMTYQINAVLDWSKITKIKDDFSPVDLNLIMNGIRSDLDLMILQKEARIEVSVLPVISGLSQQMTQLFSNLIGNAIKFCTKAPVVSITARDFPAKEVALINSLDAKTSYAEICVSDNGIGFEQQFSEQIFNIFQRLNGRSEFPGTGIGLAICKRIVENHHGLIFASAKSGKGATFRIILPKTDAVVNG
jgi:light-regulated signal transduction histidine kinase (bacteriophytochrome)